MKKIVQENRRVSAGQNAGVGTIDVEYDTVLDSRKRVTIRGNIDTQNYHIKKFKNGVIVMEPRELVKPKTISEDSLNMIYNSVRNFKAGKKGKPVDLERINKILEE